MSLPAKRPKNRSSLQAAVTGGRPFSHEHVTTAFYQINGGLEREVAFIGGIQKVVDVNAQMWFEVFGRLQRVEQLTAATVVKGEQVEAYLKASRRELQTTLQQLNSNDAQRNLVLLRELNSMSRHYRRFTTDSAPRSLRLLTQPPHSAGYIPELNEFRPLSTALPSLP